MFNMGENTDNAVHGDVVDSQIDTTIETTETNVSGGSEPVNSQANEKPTQSREDNEAWKNLRLDKEKAEQRAATLERNNTIVQKYADLKVYSDADIARNFGHLDINTMEDLDNYYEAQEKNVDPELYKRLTQAEQIAQQTSEKLSKYERKEKIDGEIEAWKKDETYGTFFDKWEKEIKEMALAHNAELYPTMLAVMGQKAAELKQPNIEDIKKEAVKEYIENLRNQKPVEGGGQTPARVVKPNTSWEDARKGALAMLNQT